MKALIGGLAGAASAKMSFTEHVNTARHIYNQGLTYLAATPETQQVSQEPIKLDGVACQYWYDNAWYNLQDFDNSGDFFMSTHADGKQYAAYDFCSLLSDLSSAKDICSDSNELKAFATIANYNNQAD